MDVSPHEDQLMSFAVQGLFYNEVGRIYEQGFMVGQCSNILPLTFSALTSLRSVNTEKAAGNIFLH